MKKTMGIVLGLLTSLSVIAAPEETFTLTAQTFSEESTLPLVYTCEGKDISPPLTWKSAPADTKTFALILSDPDATSGIFYHWIIYNMGKNMSSLPENIAPSTLTLGKNSWDKSQYSGPCPPKGSAHQYIFTLYALDTKLNLAKGADAKTVLNAMQGHIIGEAILKATFSRWAG